MKIEYNEAKPERKIVGYKTTEGFWLLSSLSGVRAVNISVSGHHGEVEKANFSAYLPIYEGDTITLKF